MFVHNYIFYSSCITEKKKKYIYIYIYIYILKIIIYTILHACFYMTVHSPFLFRSKKDKKHNCA